MNKLDLVNKIFEEYVETAEDKEKIVIDLNGFDYCEECKNEDGGLNIEYTVELNKALIEMFEKNGYKVYTAGTFYPENGQFKDVDVDTAVAIKQ